MEKHKRYTSNNKKMIKIALVNSSSSLPLCFDLIKISQTFYLHTHPFNGPFSRTTRVSRYQKGKTDLDLLKHETVSGSGISWAICKSAPSSREITMPAPHHSVFYRPDALPAAQPTVSKHCPFYLQCNKICDIIRTTTSNFAWTVYCLSIIQETQRTTYWVAGTWPACSTDSVKQLFLSTAYNGFNDRIRKASPLLPLKKLDFMRTL